MVESIKEKVKCKDCFYYTKSETLEDCGECGHPGALPLNETVNGDMEDCGKLTISLSPEKEIEQIYVEDFLIEHISVRGVSTFKVNLDKFAKHLINIYHFKTIFGTKSDYCYAFDGKVYQPDARAIIKSKSEKILGSYCKKMVADEIFEKIKRLTVIERVDFERTDNDLIPFENGVFQISKRKLLPHNPEYNFRFIIPITYDLSAKCPNWFKFLREALYPEDITVAQEWFGFNLFREHFIKKALICVGAKDTGKTIFLDILTRFIGERNKTGIPLQKISNGSDFTKLSLKDKHSNIYDDLSSSDLSDGGAFKVATGGGYISGEQKFGDYMQFKSFAKQTFATNKIPPVKDNDDLAYFGRWIVLKLDCVPEKIDRFLRNKLTTPEEMSGILNWSLEGLYRLFVDGDFSYDKTPEEIKVLMEVSGCPLVAFGYEVLYQNDGEIITKEDMFQVYTLWCEKSKKPRLSKEMLGRQLERYVPYILAEKHKQRIWKNARLKQEWDTFIKEKRNNDTSDSFQKNIRSI